jgi:hypothetical protein
MTSIPHAEAIEPVRSERRATPVPAQAEVHPIVPLTR